MLIYIMFREYILKIVIFIIKYLLVCLFYDNNTLHLYSAFLGTQSALHTRGESPQPHFFVFGIFLFIFYFYYNNILLLSNSEVKTKTFSILLVKDIPCSGTPEIAISTQSVIFKPHFVF